MSVSVLVLSADSEFLRLLNQARPVDLRKRLQIALEINGARGCPAPQPQPSPASPTPSRRSGVRRGIFAGVVVLLGAYALAGFYFVQPDERGVVRWFGRIPASQQSAAVRRRSGPALRRAAAVLPSEYADHHRKSSRVFVGMTKDLREAIDRGETWAHAGQSGERRLHRRREHP